LLEDQELCSSLILNSVSSSVPQDFLCESRFTLDEIFAFLKYTKPRQLRPSSFCLANDEARVFARDAASRYPLSATANTNTNTTCVRRVYQVVIETSRFTIAAALPVGADRLSYLTPHPIWEWTGKRADEHLPVDLACIYAFQVAHTGSFLVTRKLC
jgi:hypothetical protein